MWVEQQQNQNRDFDQKYRTLEEGITSLTNEDEADDSSAKEKINQILNDNLNSFIEFLNKAENWNRKDSIKNAIQSFLAKNRNLWGGKTSDPAYESILNLANLLNITTDSNSWNSLENQRQDNELKLEWNLDIIDATEEQKKNRKFYSKINEKKGAEWWEEQLSEIEKTEKNINTTLSKIEALIGNTNITPNIKTSLEWIKSNLQSIKNVVENPSIENTKKLQTFIWNNLEDSAKSKFEQKNHYNKTTKSFDGKFWVSTLSWINTLLSNISAYIVQQEQIISQSWASTNQNENQSTEHLNDQQAWNQSGEVWNQGDNTTQNPQQIQQTQWTSTSISGTSGTFSSSSVTRGGHIQPSVDMTTISTNISVTSNGNENIVGSSTSINNPTEHGNEISNWDVWWTFEIWWNVYNLKFDASGNLCPVARETSWKIRWVESDILIKNKQSCINYLKNKITDIDWVDIVWNSKLEDYAIRSYGKILTIEPMTIAWDWVSSDLSVCLKLLNLTNYLRSGDVDLHGMDPNLKLKDWKVFVRVAKQHGRRKDLKLETFGLSGIDDKTRKKFVKYNNHEDWRDNWDKKKPNRNYKKLDFPDVQITTSWNGPSDPTNTPSNSPVGTTDTPSNAPSGSTDTPSNAPSGSADTPSNAPSGSADTPSNAPDNNQTDNLNWWEIPSNLWKMKESDFQAMQSRLWDKMFIMSNNGKITYDLAKTKAYLEGLKETSWKDLNTKEWVAWISAVQIMLNEKFWDWKEKLVIDGKRWPLTKERVKEFQWTVEGLVKDWAPGKETIKKLLSESWKIDNWWDTPSQENQQIKNKIDNFNTDNPEIDLSELSSLSENEAEQIVKWIKEKLSTQTLQKTLLLKLNGLSNIEEWVAKKLSSFEWWIMIDKILNNINFDNCDSEIAMLKNLAPETNEKIKIIAPTQEICDKLKWKGINNVETIHAE